MPRASSGVATWTTRPARMTATRSPRANASVWSCVTYTAVTASRSNSAARSSEQAIAEAPIERSERLVEEQHTRLGCERACERDPLLLATRERPDGASLEAREPDELEELGRACGDRVVRVAAHAQAECDVPEHVAVREEGVVLEDEPDAPAIRRRPSEVDSVQQHAPCVGHVQAGDHPQQRRLAGAARPQHGDDLSVGDAERRTVENGLVVEPHDDVLGAKHRDH